MKIFYVLGIDVAKHKVRAALADGTKRILWQEHLPVTLTGVNEIVAKLKTHVARKEQLLVLIEATGVLHLNWSAALTGAGYAVAVINPLIARRLYRLENSIRDNKSDPIDARGLCAIGLEQGAKLLSHYRFSLKPEQFASQRLHSVRKVLRRSLTNLKKTYISLLDLIFPELGGLLELDAVGIRQLLAQAPTPQAIARMRLSTLEKNWMLRPKAAQLKSLAASSIADPALAATSAPALLCLLQSIAVAEARLQQLDRQIKTLTCQNVDQKTIALLESIPGFGSVNVTKVLAYLPGEILHAGNNRKAAARLQAFMGNDPRLKQSGQWKGHTKMSKRGVETLRTAFFQSAFSASQTDPELRLYYQRKRAQGKDHQVALSHLMRILTRRMIAVLRSQQPYRPQKLIPFKNAA